MRHNIYNFYKESPQTDGNNNPLYSTRKQYWNYVNGLLSDLGLRNAFETYVDETPIRKKVPRGQKYMYNDWRSDYIRFTKSGMDWDTWILDFITKTFPDPFNNGICGIMLDKTPNILEIPSKRTRKKCTGYCEVCGNYVYLTIKNTKYLSWNTLIRDLKIKKNSKAFFITYYKSAKRTGFLTDDKILAVKFSNDYFGNMAKLFSCHQDYLDDHYNKNVEILEGIPYPFGRLVNFTDVFTNEILEFKDIEEYIKESKYTSQDFYNYKNEQKYKNKANIFYREYNNTESTFNKINKKLKELEEEDKKKKENEIKNYINSLYSQEYDYGNNNDLFDEKPKEENKDDIKIEQFEYEKDVDYGEGLIAHQTFKSNYYFNPKYIINDITNKNEVSHKLLKVYFGFLYNHPNTNKEEYIEFVNNITLKYAQIKNENLDPKIKRNIYRLAKYAAKKYRLNKNNKFKYNRHISNCNLLSPAENVMIDMFLTNEAFNKTNIYNKKKTQEQYKIFLNYFIKEVFGKMKYELKHHNRKYKIDEKKDIYDYNIEHIFVSNREFNLIIDNLKDSIKDFDLRPSSDIKYKILQALDIKVSKEYDPGICARAVRIYEDFIKDYLQKFMERKKFNVIPNVNDFNIDIALPILNTIYVITDSTDPPDE